MTPSIERTQGQAGTDLVQRRRQAGMTQIQLAIAARCSRSTIAILEAGYEPRHSDVLPRLLAALDVAPGR